MLTEYTGAARSPVDLLLSLALGPSRASLSSSSASSPRGPQRRCDRSGGSPGCSCSCACSQPRGSCHNRSRDLLLDPALENPISPPLPLPSSLFHKTPSLFHNTKTVGLEGRFFTASTRIHQGLVHQRWSLALLFLSPLPSSSTASSVPTSPTRGRKPTASRPLTPAQLRPSTTLPGR